MVVENCLYDIPGHETLGEYVPRYVSTAHKQRPDNECKEIHSLWPINVLTQKIYLAIGVDQGGIVISRCVRRRHYGFIQVGAKVGRDGSKGII